MANYQTDFLQALGMASNSLSGLMRDIREPDFQDKLKLQEESNMRMLEAQAGIQEDRDILLQGFALEQMDENQKDALERMNQQGVVNLELYKGQQEVNNYYTKDLAEWTRKFNMESPVVNQAYLDQEYKDGKTNAEYLIESAIAQKKFESDEIFKQQVKEENQGKGLFGIKEQIYRNQGFLSKFISTPNRRSFAEVTGKRAYNFETDLMVDRQNALRGSEVLDAIYAASGVSQEFAEENTETLNGLNAYYSSIDFNNPAEVVAANRLLSQQNQGLFAQVRFDDMQSMAMNNVLMQGDTPDFDIENIVGKIDDTKKDRFFGRSPDQRMEMAEARKNAYSSSLGLATLQAQYALQDKFAGVNTSRQKEALKDLIEAKTLAERLSTEQKFGSTKKADIDKNKAYYQESVKMLNTWINALQK